MRKAITAIMALAAAPACVSEELEAARQLREVPGPPAWRDAARRVACLYGQCDLAERVEVRWTQEPFEIPGMGLLDGFSGANLLDCDVWLAASLGEGYDPYTLAQSSLAHELAHCAIYYDSWYMGCDSDHGSDEWWDPTHGRVTQAEHMLEETYGHQ